MSDPVIQAHFPDWIGLQLWICNGHKNGKELDRLLALARAFVPYPIFWQGGCAIADAPYGQYIWHFAVELEQHRIWNTRAFRNGRKFGQKSKPPYRDANPHSTESTAQSAWDVGYILGLSERKPRRAARLDRAGGE